MATHAEKWPAGTPCWVELTVKDLDRSQQFYRAVLGWEFDDAGEAYGHYTNALLGGRRVAGISPPSDDMDWPSMWTTYLATDDIDETEDAAIGAGAKPVIEPMEVGEFGRVALWVDPSGVAFGAWEADAHTGYEVHHEPGAVAWIDLVTADLEESKAFYGNVFRYTYEDTPMGDMAYAVFTPPGTGVPAGGMGPQSPGDRLPPRWTVTFEVDDVDAAMARVVEAGGRADDEPFEFEYGRLVSVKGPDGEDFSLITPAPVSDD
ncbi:hypothetical protein BCF74_12648 [Knoellia remsis]|uniref:VOC domain-containing protein n=1 Tax=Knoellia remsis TaxID=407159 RepID=A0A2T0U7Z6_9MICO|nr:VOC family protein [Knoellia remsis]PRY54034.1 hypothetical protein BCF74_12648 [Knoellia remsis]